MATLQLALVTAAHPNSGAIRSGAYQNLLLHQLSSGSRSENEICAQLQTTLRLQRPLPVASVLPYLRALETSQFATTSDGRWELTPSGQEAIQDEEASAASALLEGRKKLRAALEELTGVSFADAQYAQIWTVIQNKVAHRFQTQGHSMVALIGRMSALETIDGDEPSDLPMFVDELANAVAATSSSPDFADTLKIAVRDIFQERCGPAYDWLSRVCASYVLVCTLGLEFSTGQRLRHLLANMALVLDTDVCLELLAEGEPNHTSAHELWTHGRMLGMQFLAAEPVVEELAHHAHIAQRDYAEVKERFLDSEQDRRRFVKNVFVRSFGHLVQLRKLRRRDWSRFIANYRGQDERDATPVRAVLTHDYHMAPLPDMTVRDEPAAAAWRVLESWLSAGNGTNDQRIRRDKARRDARLYGSLRRLADAKEAGGGAAEDVVLVTSAHRLKRLESKLGGKQQQALSLAETLYLVAMVPNVSLGLSALKTVLFDSRILPRSSELELLIERAIQDSDEYSVPRARRATVHREAREAMIRAARDQGETKLHPDRMRIDSLDDQQRSTIARAVAAGLTATGADTKLERELEDARKRIRDLEDRLYRKGRKS